jgi:hypothetical protein
VLFFVLVHLGDLYQGLSRLLQVQRLLVMQQRLQVVAILLQTIANLHIGLIILLGLERLAINFHSHVGIILNSLINLSQSRHGKSILWLDF